MSLTKVTYSLIDGEVINVLDYGADPTGVADSTTAFQNALNYLGAAEIASGVFPTPDQVSAGGAAGVLYVPTGTYKITSTLQMHTATTIRGNGPFSSVLNYTGTGKAICMGSGITGDGALNGYFTEYVAIEKIGLKGTANATDGIFIYGCIRFRLQDLMVDGFSKSVPVDYTSVPYPGASFSANTVQLPGGSGVHLFDFVIFGLIQNVTCRLNYFGIKATNCSPTASAQCFNAIEVCGQGEYVANQHGIVVGNYGIANTGSIVGQGSNIHDITAESNSATGVWITEGRQIDINNCYFEGNGTYDIQIGDTTNVATCARCDVLDNYIGGRMNVIRATQCTFGNNTFQVDSGSALTLAANTSFCRANDNRLNGSPMPVITNNGSTGTNVVSSIVNGFVNPTLLNSWANVGGSNQVAGYYSDYDGFIHLRGLVGSGSASSVIFTIPATDAFPAKYERFVVSDGGTATSTVEIRNNGTSTDVYCVAVGAGAKVSLSGITFKAFGP